MALSPVRRLADVLHRVYDVAQGLLEVESSTLFDLVVLTSFCPALWTCHSFKGCALPPSLLFHKLLFWW